MKRFALICGMLVLLGSARAQAAIEPTDADRGSFATGVRQWQMIVMLGNPRNCAIVLLRANCVALIPALRPGSGASAAVDKLHTFASNGDKDAYDKNWGDANDPGPIDESDWKANPRATWLRTAGVVWESSFDPFFFELLGALRVRGLSDHIADAGPYAELLPKPFRDDVAAATRNASPGPVQMQGLKATFVPNLTQTFGIEAQPAVSVDAGLPGDRQLGVYAATAAEMFEIPTLFTEPQSRAFLAALSERLAADQPSPDETKLAHELAARFPAIDGPEAWNAANADFTKIAVLRPPLRESRRDAFIYGAVTAQLAYNAAFLRETDAERQQLAVIARFTAAEGGDVALAQKRGVLLGVDVTDWHALNAAATAMTLEIMHPGARPDALPSP